MKEFKLKAAAGSDVSEKSRENDGSDEEYIKLGQLIKAAGMVSNGAEAKLQIQSGMVKVNGEVCTMRGKKIKNGDIVEYDGNEVRVTG